MRPFEAREGANVHIMAAMGRRDGPWGTRAAMDREAGGRACLLWVLWMDRRVSCVSIVFCGSESSLHAVGCVCRMGPRTAVSYVPYVSLLRSIRACIYPGGPTETAESAGWGPSP